MTIADELAALQRSPTTPVAPSAPVERPMETHAAPAYPQARAPALTTREKDVADGIARAADSARQRGAITAAVYATDAATLERAADAFAAAGDIEAGPGAGGEAGDHAVVDMDIGRLEATVGHQHAAAQKVQRHITIRSVRAPGRRFGERTSIVSMRDEFAKTQQRNRDS